uniref:Carbonic anhydrase n=1 Tax=Sphaeramia orbicularis TaxID=375764 RepID=A0A673AK48_9TELE
MRLFSLLPCLFLAAFLKCVSACGSEWCYTGCPTAPSEWHSISGSFCGNKRQSPINITCINVKKDDHLGNFTFVNFTSKHVITKLTNTGHTVKYHLMENEVEVSGGGLNGTYTSLQFHFHWGYSDHHQGSEHLINGHRYPMEVTDDEDMSGPWDNLTSYITCEKDSDVNITAPISIHDLIGNVDLTKYFRYMGSLTTPLCNEAVVWTVFEEPIKISKKLIERFPTKTGYTSVYRPPQPLNGRTVYASPAVHIDCDWCYDNHCEFSPTHWHMLPGSFCDGNRQSPVDIVTKNTVENKDLGDFVYTKFDDKHVIKYIINTGHAVKCVLKEDMVEVSEGGLGHNYSTLQFHFHWGTTSDNSTGSEHTVDSKRYQMEMHIVNKRKDLTLEEAVKTPNGLAVLAFFMEAAESHKSKGRSGDSEETSHTSDEDPWKKLTSYLPAIQNISSHVEVKKEISIDDLLGDVNRHEYYRYNGSLTTPSCNEAVVWTVFKEPVKVDPSLMKMFPAQAGYSDAFRPLQSHNSRKIYKTSAAPAPGPAILVLLLAFYCSFSANFHL